MLTILTTALAFLRTPRGRYVLIGLAVALALWCLYEWIYGRGEAAALAAAAAASAAAVARANKARAAVDHSAEAAKRDPANRDNGGR